MQDSFFEQLSKVSELNELAGELTDPAVDEALSLIIKLTAKPDVPIRTAAPLIVQLTALSAQFKLQGKYYMLYSKEKENMAKKNTYLSLSESLQCLADSLKYLLRAAG